LKVITEQYVLDLAIKQQFLAAKSQYLQANTQANGARKALSKAKWDMAKALGLNVQADFSVRKEIPFSKLDVDLPTCLRLAAAHRPDLQMQESLVDIAKEGREVMQASYFPRLNLNSFYGRSGAAFESEAFNYRKDWQVNASLSQSFFGNSLGASGSAIDTSPKLGQSSRTETRTQGVNMAFLDGMRQKTDLKQSDLSYRQAALKRDEIRRDVAMDVENAYYNLNQTMLQVEFSEEDLKLAEEELKVAESKSKYGLAAAVEMAQTRNRLAGSRSARTEALASYQIAVAALNRAIGIPDKFKAE
jgi:outer membrane protein TolC